MTKLIVKCILIPALQLSVLPMCSHAQYTWLDSYDSTNAIVARIPPPDDFIRAETEPGSFARWLRYLRLKPDSPPIYLYNGEKKFNQLANYAIIDIDIGKNDLQQCADAVIRLRSEYFYSKNQFDSIAFDFTSGDRFAYTDWLDGKTPEIDGNNVTWHESPRRENNRESFRKYLDIIFTYAGSYSLSREMMPVNLKEMRIGDVFIEGGFPGHAMIVVDIAQSTKTSEKVFLLAQSYTPAQSVHIVKNPLHWFLSPWYKGDFWERLYTMEWVFHKDDLRRFH